MIYYLFDPKNKIDNLYWYKYLEIHDTIEDYLWSFKADSFFISDHFTVYISQKYECYDKTNYNICRLSKDIYLQYYDDVVFILSDKRRDTEVLKLLNYYKNKK